MEVAPIILTIWVLVGLFDFFASLSLVSAPFKFLDIFGLAFFALFWAMVGPVAPICRWRHEGDLSLYGDFLKQVKRLVSGAE